MTGEFVDLVKAGIIDPAKVTRSALQNAASIAGLLLTTEALVADKPEKPNPLPLRQPWVAAAWVAWAAWAAWAGWAVSEPVRLACSPRTQARPYLRLSTGIGPCRARPVTRGPHRV